MVSINTYFTKKIMSWCNWQTSLSFDCKYGVSIFLIKRCVRKLFWFIRLDFGTTMSKLFLLYFCNEIFCNDITLIEF